MAHIHPGVRAGCLSRRKVLCGLAGLMVTISLEGCAQAFSPSLVTPTVSGSTPRPRGSVIATYHGHTDRVTSVAWSPDGKYIASGSLDQTVRIWAVNSGDHAPLVIYRGHTAGVQAVGWSPDSKRVVSGSIDKTIQVWGALTGEQLALYRGHSASVNTLAWSPDGKAIVSGSADSSVRLWDDVTGQPSYVYNGHQASVNSIVWSPDSQRIASGSSDKTVQILDAASGSHLYTYRGHADVVSSVSWSPDGKYIASGSWDKTAQVWDALSGDVLYRYHGYNVQAAQLDPTKGVLPDLIFVVAWSPNGRRIAAVTQVYCGDICGVVVSWDASTQRNFTFYPDSPIFDLAWSPDNTRFVSSITVSTQGPLPQAAPEDGSFVQITQA